MSTLNVSNITDGTTTVGTSYVVNGSAKAWVDFGQVGTQSINDSFNVSSITDVAVGRTVPTITNAMASSNYHVSFSMWDIVNYLVVSVGSSKTTTGFLFATANTSSAADDADQVTLAYTGDLA